MDIIFNDNSKWNFFFLCRIPDVHCVHFVDGIPHINFPKLDIYHHGNHFTVTGVVQYKNNPDHFVVWIRNPTGQYECQLL